MTYWLAGLRPVLDCEEQGGHDIVAWVEQTQVDGRTLPAFLGMRCAKCALKLPGATCRPTDAVRYYARDDD